MTSLSPAAKGTAILHPASLPSVDRGSGASTVQLVTQELGSTGFLNGITTFAPGASIAHHTHNCAESVVIIEGDAIVDIDGVETHLVLFDTTFVPGNISHRFRNASDTAVMRILWTYASVDATRTLIATGDTGRVDGEQAG
ncbi:cupin domain-containing protein [Cryobacterium sp. Y62]|uniref:cupin domain-containing protein n=1 Tax=Cryobacterium sp. Y62 TaxID=2048284 RepID=UPI000CE3F56E|nr:cupin domain-containing protein [Cryobacterium sp. Y62]